MKTLKNRSIFIAAILSFSILALQCQAQDFKYLDTSSGYPDDATLVIKLNCLDSKKCGEGNWFSNPEFKLKIQVTEKGSDHSFAIASVDVKDVKLGELKPKTAKTLNKEIRIPFSEINKKIPLIDAPITENGEYSQYFLQLYFLGNGKKRDYVRFNLPSPEARKNNDPYYLYRSKVFKGLERGTTFELKDTSSYGYGTGAKISGKIKIEIPPQSVEEVAEQAAELQKALEKVVEIKCPNCEDSLYVNREILRKALESRDATGKNAVQSSRTPQTAARAQ